LHNCGDGASGTTDWKPKRSHETRYYITSVENDAALILESIRAHWGIENGLHWALDIGFREDESRVRKDHAPRKHGGAETYCTQSLEARTDYQNRHQSETTQAAWDQDYLLKSPVRLKCNCPNVMIFFEQAGLIFLSPLAGNRPAPLRCLRNVALGMEGIGCGDVPCNADQVQQLI